MEGALSPRRNERTPTQAREILDYFLRNPQAADNLEGVARWRLMQEQVHRSVEEVDQALGWLVAEGLLLKESAEGSDAIFRLNVDKRAQAQRLLAKSGIREGGGGTKDQNRAKVR